MELSKDTWEGYPRAKSRGKTRLEDLLELIGFEQEGRSFYERQLVSGYEGEKKAVRVGLNEILGLPSLPPIPSHTDSIPPLSCLEP